MTANDLRVLRLAGALRAKAHTLPEAVLDAEWKAVDRAKLAAEGRVADAAERVILAHVAPGFDLAAMLADLLDALDGPLGEALRAGFATGLARMDVRLPFDADRPSVAQALSEIMERQRSVPNTLASRIETIVSDGLARGLDRDAIGQLVRAAAPEIAKNSAELIGQTAATASFEAGQVESFKDAGVETHRWLTQRDDRVRDEHAALDGEEVRVGQAFSNGVEYPSEPRCRCTLLPIIPAAASRRGRAWRLERDAKIRERVEAVRPQYPQNVAAAFQHVADEFTEAGEPVSPRTVERAVWGR